MLFRSISVYIVQFPRSIAVYLKSATDPGEGSLTIPKQRPLKIKQAKQTGKQFKNDLNPKVNPTLYFVPSIVARSVIRWQNRLLILVCVFCSQNVAVSKSRHRLLFYPIGKRKKNRKTFFEMFLSTGGVDYRKGRC